MDNMCAFLCRGPRIGGRRRSAAVCGPSRQLVIRGRRAGLVLSALLVGISACATSAQHAIDTIPHMPSVISLPIQVVNGWIVVQAEIGGRQGAFMLDTGAPAIVLNGKYLMQGVTGFDTVTATHPYSDSLSRHPSVTATYPDSLSQYPDSDSLSQHPVPVQQSPSALPVRVNTPMLHVNPSTVDLPIGFDAQAKGMLSYIEREAGRPILGVLGAKVLEPFETVIDYAHQQLTLIPIDTAGHRLTAVPTYTPVTTVPMMALDEGRSAPGPYWYVQGRIGDAWDTLLVDTGNHQGNWITNQTKFERHLVAAGYDAKWQAPRMTLDHVQLASRSFDAIPVLIEDGADTGDVLADAFFIQQGVVGFNFRASQLILYH